MSCHYWNWTVWFIDQRLSFFSPCISRKWSSIVWRFFVQRCYTLKTKKEAATRKKKKNTTLWAPITHIVICIGENVNLIFICSTLHSSKSKSNANQLRKHLTFVWNQLSWVIESVTIDLIRYFSLLHLLSPFVTLSISLPSCIPWFCFCPYSIDMVAVWFCFFIFACIVSAICKRCNSLGMVWAKFNKEWGEFRNHKFQSIDDVIKLVNVFNIGKNRSEFEKKKHETEEVWLLTFYWIFYAGSKITILTERISFWPILLFRLPSATHFRNIFVWLNPLRRRNFTT